MQCPPTAPLPQAGSSCWPRCLLARYFRAVARQYRNNRHWARTDTDGKCNKNAQKQVLGTNGWPPWRLARGYRRRQAGRKAAQPHCCCTLVRSSMLPNCPRWQLRSMVVMGPCWPTPWAAQVANTVHNARHKCHVGHDMNLQGTGAHGM
jgi:hypothetical protein